MTDWMFCWVSSTDKSAWGCHEVELAMMLKEMTLLAPQSRAFTTVLGRAVLAQAAEHTYWSFRSETWRKG